jgi:OTU domain-containing protein 6
MESLEQMQVRHRKEGRDLQSRITGKKKNATKKTRKAVNDECTQLELTLKEKHAAEIAVLNGGLLANDVDELISEDEDDKSEQLEGQSLKGGITALLEKTSLADFSEATAQAPAKKRNRQKERLARRAAEQEAEATKAESEASNMVDHRGIERTNMLESFAANALVEKLIQPDGHCLFAAIADQLQQISIPLAPATREEANASVLPAYRIVRKAASDYMEGHADDFAPFLEEPLRTYAAKIRDSAEWGGQLELVALANAFNVEICVIRSGRTETIEPTKSAEEERARIWLAYYTRGFGLGEHYNSLRKAL